MGKVLLAGIDTLAVGFNVDEYLLTPEDWAALADAKLAGQGKMFDSGGQPIVFQGHKFSMSPKGSHGYEYVLVNDDITIKLAVRATGGSAYPETAGALPIGARRRFPLGVQGQSPGRLPFSSSECPTFPLPAAEYWPRSTTKAWPGVWAWFARPLTH